LYGHAPSGLLQRPHGPGDGDDAAARGVAMTLICRSTRFSPQFGQRTLRSSCCERMSNSNALPQAEHEYS
jgi:hypothetical protein